MSRIVLRAITLLGLCAAAVALTVPAAAAAAPPRATTTDPAEAAAGWLAQQFSNAKNQRVPDGDHIVLTYDLGQGPVYYYDPGTTIDAVTALAATKTGGSRIAAATSYVAAHLDDYVDYSGAQGGPFYGSIGKAAFLAVITGRNPQQFGGHQLLTELKQDECASGSASCTAGSNSNVFSSVATSYIVLAEARAGGSFAPSANLLDFLRSEQCPDGGFSSAIPAANPCAPDVDATAYAIMALRAAGGSAPQIDKAASWLVSQRNADGSWTSNGGPNVDSTGLAAAALRATGRTASSSRTWLIGQVVTTGPTVGAGSQRGAVKYQGAYDEYASIKGTSDAIFGLIRHGDLATVTARGASSGYRVLQLARPTLAHRRVRPGGSQTVTGTGFAAGETVRVRLVGRSGSAPVGSATASSVGTARLTFTVPSGARAGRYEVRLVGSVSHLASSTSFVVPATASTAVDAASQLPSSSAPSQSLPALADTGRDGRTTHSMLEIGLGGVAIGVVMLVAGRRTRRGRHSR